MHDAIHDAMHDEKLNKLVETCAEPKTREEMMAYLGLVNRDHFRKNYLKPLLDSGKIKMTIPDKPKSKNQKYVKTD
jgi:ATP-dependent DNA helicase RecG